VPHLSPENAFYNLKTASSYEIPINHTTAIQKLKAFAGTT
jgi:hypothetical protein